MSTQDVAESDDIEPCDICADGPQECTACYGDDPDCWTCGGTGDAVPDHCCDCGGSPYCQCCSRCGEYAGTCGCPVTVRLEDGTTRTLPPVAAAVAVAEQPVAVPPAEPYRRRRWRLRWTGYPRCGIELTIVPRPSCPDCDGDGEVCVGGDEDGPEYEVCPCWEPGHRHMVLPLPRRLMPRAYRGSWGTGADPWGGGHSDEPPF